MAKECKMVLLTTLALFMEDGMTNKQFDYGVQSALPNSYISLSTFSVFASLHSFHHHGHSAH